LLCYDADAWGKQDLLGRALMEINGKRRIVVEEGDSVEYLSYKEPEWYELYFDPLKEQKGYL